MAQTAPDVLGEVLKELRLLRVAMEHSASFTSHTQLLTGRLNVQNERISVTTRELSSARELAASLANRLATETSNVSHLGGREPTRKRLAGMLGTRRGSYRGTGRISPSHTFVQPR